MSIQRLRNRTGGISVALLLAGLLGCTKSTPPTSNADLPGSSNVKPTVKEGTLSGKDKSVSKTPGVTVIAPEELGKEWQANKEAVLDKYANTTLEVTGSVRSFGIDIGGNPVAHIPCGEDEKAALINVATRDKEPWALVGPGQVVTVRGKLDQSHSLFLYLKDAEFVDPKPNKSVTIKAADLAAEVAKDRKAVIEKYKGKGLIVVGEVVKRNEKRTTVFLKGTDMLMIECRTFMVVGDGLGKPLQEGKVARIYGVLSTLNVDEDSPIFILKDCLPILNTK
jgi:hypothetical protein